MPAKYSPQHSKSIADHFWSKVDIRGADECWPWTGAIGKEGYGHFRIGKTLHKASRAAYILTHGPLPTDLHTDHLCRNRACVNPAHLEAVTAVENLMRGEGPAAQNARKAHCKRGHEFTPENTEYARSARRCIACRRIDGLSRYYKARALTADQRPFLFVNERIADHFIIRRPKGSLWLIPAGPGGWNRRRKYLGHLERLTPVAVADSWDIVAVAGYVEDDEV